MIKRKIALFIICLLAPMVVFAQSAPNTQNTYQYKLKNGLHLIVRVNTRAPVVMVNTFYKVGGSYEPNGITGISHLLEHLMFDGTKDYPAGQFDKIITSNGGQENAITSADYTVYYEKLAVDKLPIALKLEADRMHNLLITPKQFNKEIKVVREERRMRTDNNPQATTYERLKAAAFLSNPYHQPVVGWMTDLMHLTLTDAQNWYKKWYEPNNAIVVVAGDVKPEHVLHQVQEFFGAIPSQAIPKRSEHGDQSALGERVVHVRVPSKLPWVLLAYNVPVIKTAKQDWVPYALSLLNGILLDGNSSRLEKNLVRGQQIASAISGWFDPFSLYSNIFMIGATPAQGHSIKAVKAAIMQQIQVLKTQLVSQKELQRIINQVVAEKTYAKDSLSTQAMAIGSLEAVGLPWQTADQYVTEVSKITPQQIQQVARKYLTKRRLTMAVLTPPQRKQKKKQAQATRDFLISPLGSINTAS